MRDSSFYEELNYLIENNVSGFGPSTVSLLGYGPFDRRKITPDNKERLKQRSDTINKAYINDIIPKSKFIISALEGDSNLNFPQNKAEYNHYFKRREFVDVRDKLRESYKDQFDLDEVTKTALFSKATFRYQNDFIRYKFNTRSKDITSSRFKRNQSISRKFKTLYEKLNFSQKEDFDAFVLLLCSDPINFWLQRENYEETCGREITNLMIEDFIGFARVPTSQIVGVRNMERILDLYYSGQFKINGFKVHDIKDRRKRVKDERPGGLHLVLSDIGLPNFPVEVHYLDLKSKILDMFGPHSHPIYTYRGKKANPNYDD